MNAAAQRLLCIGRNVLDLERAQRFYCEALGFHAVDESRDAAPVWTQLLDPRAAAPRSARLRLGLQEIELTAFDPPGAPYPPDSTSCDLWFQHLAIVTDDMDAAHGCVMRHGAIPITREGPQTLPPSTGSVSAFKFRDPDGHPLELLNFPRGSGDPAWQRAYPRQPAPGIDHSAISVADASRSVAFYTRLGLTQTARQINRGPGQQLLDALDDVQVDVVALRPAAADTPHVELLGYRTPHGRPMHANDVRDIAADRLVLQVHGLAALLKVIKDAGTTIGIDVAVGEDRHAALLRDPDGHLLVLVE